MFGVSWRRIGGCGSLWANHFKWASKEFAAISSKRVQVVAFAQLLLKPTLTKRLTDWRESVVALMPTGFASLGYIFNPEAKSRLKLIIMLCKLKTKRCGDRFRMTNEESYNKLKCYICAFGLMERMRKLFRVSCTNGKNEIYILHIATASFIVVHVGYWICHS